MGQLALLRHAVEALDAASVPYMLTGSYASSLQGQPRATHDIDFVVNLEARQISRLLAAFPEDRYYFSEDAIELAVRDRAMFNVLDVQEGDKIDFWLLTDDPFDRERFKRRMEVLMEDGPLWVSTPEDTILMKLRWAAESGGSERQFGDARHVYTVSRDVIDEVYLDHWGARMGLEDSLADVRAE